MPSSSYVDPGKMRGQIASTKAREQIEREQAEAEEAEAAKKAEAATDQKGKENKTGEEADDGPQFSTVWGMLSSKELLSKYSGVRDTVRDKRYFLSGYATQEIVLGGQTFVFRTLKKAEQRLCMILAEDSVRHPQTGDPMVVPDEFLRWQLLMMVKSVGGEEWDDLAIPAASSAKRFKEESDKEIKRFCESEEVVRRSRIVNDWPEQLYDKLVQHCQAINLAYSVAIEEDLQNP
jgi:hypothetical protein